METYHIDHDRSCLENVAKALKANQTDDGETIVGFMAETLRSAPEARAIYSIPDLQPRAKASLARAFDLLGEHNNLRGFFSALFGGGGEEDGDSAEASAAKPDLDTLVSHDDVNTNDLLIGAFMASGNQDHLARILRNYDTADDQMTADALREGMLLLRYWTHPTQVDRTPVKTMLKLGCDRYGCKPRTHSEGRLMTLSTAYWAFFKHSAKDDGFRDAMNVYRARHLQFALAEAQERAAADNYASLSIAYATRKDDLTLAKAFDAYESFRPLSEVLPRFTLLAKALPGR
jgi:hypothetical protein